LRLNPSTLLQHQCAALGYFAQQQWSKAAEFAETATLRRPNGLTGWVALAAANDAQGNSNSAASSYLTLCERTLLHAHPLS
jgi:hypothetical protein